MIVKTAPVNEFAADGPYLTRRQKAWGIVNGTPEVVFVYDRKGTGKRIDSPQALQDAALYIARNGKLEVEDEEGVALASRESVVRTVEGWLCSETQEFEGDRTGHRLKLSVKGKPKSEAFKGAVRAWASEHLKGHPYVMGFHFDTDNSHAHILIRARNLETGNQFSVQGKQDAERYRESFAAKLIERGIEANATMRYTRGVFEIRKTGGEVQQEKRGVEQPRLKKLGERLKSEARGFFKMGVLPIPHISVRKACDTRAQVTGFAQAFAQELYLTKDERDRELSQRLLDYYKALPSPEMRLAQQVEQLHRGLNERIRQWKEEDRREAEKRERERLERERQERERLERERQEQERQERIWRELERLRRERERERLLNESKERDRGGPER